MIKRFLIAVIVAFLIGLIANICCELLKTDDYTKGHITGCFVTATLFSFITYKK